MGEKMNKYTFEGYQDMPDAMTFEEMSTAYHGLIDGVGQCDSECEELFDALLNAAFTYTDMRMRWMRFSLEQKASQDNIRTQMHNACIAAVTIIARYMHHQKKDIKWAEIVCGLSQEDILSGNMAYMNLHRKRIGDFMNYIGFVHAVNAR
ncbi:hypothetical protein FC40_GL000943 [Ligilactobacillus hayakitensis DSM 18933 = JCM 14209]|uniref:Uncharacterized protein n=2 Tax=Ligilactobacillus TaxID=2767887 RepID=A0A0R1WQN1_9LACO|nr:hypothetical protein FC40_GL000943 [Ligilactobacillus hayakitensis DSM 18933 = JCM 14209]